MKYCYDRDLTHDWPWRGWPPETRWERIRRHWCQWQRKSRAAQWATIVNALAFVSGITVILLVGWVVWYLALAGFVMFAHVVLAR